MGDRKLALFGDSRRHVGAAMLGELQGQRRHRWFAGGLAGAVALHTVRSSLDDALVALHPANQPSFSTNRLHDGPRTAAAALRTWDTASAEFAGFLRDRAHGRDLARLHTVAELGYSLLAGGLLLALVGWLFVRLAGPDHGLRRGVLRWAGTLCGLYVALGIVDQLIELRIVGYRPETWPDSGIDGFAGFLATLLKWSSVLRRATLAAILVPIVIGLVAVARERRPLERVRSTGSPYRVLIALVAAYAVALNAGTTAEQALDAIRLWSGSVRLTIVGIAACAWFSTTVFVIARRVGRAPEPALPADERVLALRVAGVGITLIAVGAGAERFIHRGGGVAVLGAILLVIAALSGLLLARLQPAERATVALAATARPLAGHAGSDDAADAAAHPPGAATYAAEAMAEATDRDDTAEMDRPVDHLLGEAGSTRPSPATATGPESITLATPPNADASGPDSAPLLPSLLGLLPYVLLARAILQAAIPEAIAPEGSMWLLPIAVVVLVAACVLYVRSRRSDFFTVGADRRRYDPLFRQYVGVSAAVVVIIVGWVLVHVWSIAPALGVHGLLASFLAGTTLLFGIAAYGTERWPVPAALRLVGLRRWPLVSMVILWGVLASMIRGGYHDVRLLHDDGAPRGAVASALVADRSLTAESAFAAWVRQNVPPIDPAAAGGGRRPVVPMVFVAAQGGGIRAASFTSATLDCLFTRLDPVACPGSTLPAGWDRVFVLSGASGGSVGIASTTTQWAAHNASGRQEPGWVARRLGGDMLSPSLAWQLFVEAPNTLLHLQPGTDRAEIIERTWERRWKDVEQNAADDPLLGIDDGWRGPLMLLNGSNVRDGCRVNVSRLDGSDPVTGSPSATPAEADCRRLRLDTDPVRRSTLAVNRDLTDYLCADEDLRLSTAAFLSARFPFVSPTGELRSAPDRGRACARADLPRLSVGDGGYRDNTGASAIIETWAEIEPLVANHNRTADTCVVPFLIEIDNGHRNLDPTSEPGRIGQLVAPLSGALNVFSARDAGWIEAAANEFSRSLGGVEVYAGAASVAMTDRFSRVSLFSHPGVQAPLGWSLSPSAVRDISGQLAVPANRAALDEIATWLTPGNLTCA